MAISDERKIILEVKGMMCQKSCGSTIENALRSMDGVIEAEASFINHEAYATIDSSLCSTEDLIDTIECIGFEASVKERKKEVILKVDGMMCQKSCGTTVANALQAVSGVVDAKASFAKSEAYVAIDASGSTTTTANDLIDTIEAIGFDASLPYTRVQLSIIGMMCQKSCGSTVENALTLTKGVLYAQASFADKNAIVIIDPNIIHSTSNLIDIIETIGFEASIQTEELYDFEQMFEISSFNEYNDNHNNNTTTNNENDNISNNTEKYPSTNLMTSEQHSEETNQLGELGSNSSNVLTFRIGGMSCAVCSGKVQRTLEDINGVLIASVVLTTQRAQVQIDPATNEDGKKKIATSCCSAVEAKGYECDYMNMNHFNLRDNANSLEKSRKDEINGWAKLLIISLLFTLPLLYVMKTTPKQTMINGVMTEHPCVLWRLWTVCILSTMSQFIVGYRFYRAAYNSGYDWGMDFLVVLGTSCAYIYSLIVFVIILVNPNNHFDLEPSFSTGPMLLSFVTLGKFLESYAKGKTAAALQSLCELQPMFATKVIDFKENDDHSIIVDTSALKTEEVSAWDLYPGDYIRVLPGSRIPADGILVAVGGGSNDSSIVDSSNDNKSKRKRQEAYIDESAFSGEPIPVSKRVGDSLYGSSVNQLSVLVVKVTATGAETVLAKIVKLMEDAQSNQAPIQAFADYAASIFAPCIIFLATITLFMWIVVNVEETNLKIRVFEALMSAISVIVVACPCALGLATPTAVMVGTGVGATHGLLIKGGAVLEETHSINKIILDKTGTCTTGKVVLGHRIEFIKDTNDELLQNLPSKIDHTNLSLWLSSCAEIQSEHPLARAIVNSAKSMWGADVTFSNEGVQVTEFDVVPGFGVQCCVHKPNWGSYIVRIGSRQFTKESNHNSNIDNIVEDDSTGDKEVEKLRKDGEIAVYVSVLKNTRNDLLLSEQERQTSEERRRIIGVLGIIDPIKKEAKSAVEQLIHMGVDVYMCTGDHELTANSVAKQIGIPISNVRSSMKPEQKAEMVSELQNEERKQNNYNYNKLSWLNLNKRRDTLPTFDDGGFSSSNDANKKKNTVAMVGDGINDAIALARSNVGIAIGAGTEVAVEAANIVLLRSNLYDVVIAIHLSKVVFKRIQMNFMWAIGYNALAIPFASGLMYPITGFRLPPEYAGLMMAFSSVSVVTSSLLLRNYKVPKTSNYNNISNVKGQQQQKTINNETIIYDQILDATEDENSIDTFDEGIESCLK